MATSGGAAVLKYSTYSVTFAESYTTELSGLSDNRINAVITYGPDARWFATRQGLSLFLGNKWYSETAFGDLIMSPAISLGTQSDGWILAGTSGLGVGRFRYDAGIDGITGASYYNTDWSGLPSDTILAVYIDKDNHQWFGTPKGVACHSDWQTKVGWKVYTIADGLVNNRVQAICGDSTGLMWFGTIEGLSSFDGQNWKSYTTGSGLINQSVNDISVDNGGTLWIATNGGISTFDGTTWKSYFRQ
jgi:ligand-binding sensor domain-containing protein